MPNLLLVVIAALISQVSGTNFTHSLVIKPQENSFVLGEHHILTLVLNGSKLHDDFNLTVATTPFFYAPSHIEFYNLEDSVIVNVTATAVVSETFFEVTACTMNNEACTDIDLSHAYARMSVLKSRFIDILVVVVGWAYFFAWSVSFYPQMILNYQRKSVVGLNFDFLFLNIVGFAAYTIYNCMNYWDPAVKEEYSSLHPRSPLPVLMNDVIFAVHALAACIFTAFQAVIYERQKQRVHPVFIGYGSALIGAGIITFALSFIGVISYLQFVTSLSYIKMAVTCSKYFPQAIYNYRRQSTVGWSIGNVLLDFTGGLLDVMQMVLQAWNVDDWSAFVGNPVKFGLGMVSMVFDVVFFIQHYILYRHRNAVPETENESEPSASPEDSESVRPTDSSANLIA